MRKHEKRYEGLARVALEANSTIHKRLVDVKDEFDSATEENARLREDKNRIQGSAWVKLEAIQNELDATTEAGEHYYQRLQASEASFSLFLEEYEQLRRDLAHASNEACMWQGCRRNGIRRHVLTRCRHVVCDECIKGYVLRVGVNLASEPNVLALNGLCACKAQGCTKTLSEALIINGGCPPA